MKDLMIHVERVVRPIRADRSRKLRMRRELLAHLQDAVAQEQAGGVSGQVAVERAMQRLGQTADLTRQLQESVPRLEQIMHTPVSQPILGCIGGFVVTPATCALAVLAAGAIITFAIADAVLLTLGVWEKLGWEKFLTFPGVNCYAISLVVLLYGRMSERCVRPAVIVVASILLAVVQAILTLLLVHAIAHRAPAWDDFTLISGILLGSLLLVALAARAMRRFLPLCEDEWLGLKISP